MCSTCLGVTHAQAGLASPVECIHCAAFPRKLLKRRLARLASLAGKDPLMCAVAAPEDECGSASGSLTATPGPSWVPQLLTTSPPHELEEELGGLPAAQLSWGDIVEAEEGSADSELQFSDEEEDSESVAMASVSGSQPRLTAGGDLSPGLSPALLDLHDMCRRAAVRLGIQWPAAQTEAPRSRFDS